MSTSAFRSYFLFEPPHHRVLVNFYQSIFDVLSAGYVPVITHPDRLAWLEDASYHWLVEPAHNGAWIQVKGLVR